MNDKEYAYKPKGHDGPKAPSNGAQLLSQTLEETGQTTCNWREDAGTPARKRIAGRDATPPDSLKPTDGPCRVTWQPHVLDSTPNNIAFEVAFKYQVKNQRKTLMRLRSPQHTADPSPVETGSKSAGSKSGSVCAVI